MLWILKVYGTELIIGSLGLFTIKFQRIERRGYQRIMDVFQVTLISLGRAVWLYSCLNIKRPWYFLWFMIEVLYLLSSVVSIDNRSALIFLSFRLVNDLVDLSKHFLIVLFHLVIWVNFLDGLQKLSKTFRRNLLILLPTLGILVRRSIRNT